MTAEMTVDFWVGDTAEIVAQLPAGSVDVIVTSPPFYRLRSYLPDDAPEKALEHGSERSPATFLANLLDQVELWGTKLAAHGSIAVELGDTRSGSGGGSASQSETRAANGQARNGDYPNRNLIPRSWVPSRAGAPRPKSLCLIPQAFALSLAYGRNILALPGQPEWREFEPWTVRNVVRWVRANPPVGAMSDRWRDATSEITVATRDPGRWWDDIATRRDNPRASEAPTLPPSKMGAASQQNKSLNPDHRQTQNPAGAPLLDWWLINPSGFTSAVGEHFASWPPDLCVPFIEAMCPRRVCTRCGQPSRRIVEKGYEPDERGGSTGKQRDLREPNGRVSGTGMAGQPTMRLIAETVGWSSCGCPGADGPRLDGWHTGTAWRPGVVLDPYCGTGTTLAVAHGHSRSAVGVDLNPANAALVVERLGMFVRVHEKAAA